MKIVTPEISKLSVIYRVLNYFPIKNNVIKFLFQKYVDYCNNDNNIDINSNGELFFIKKYLNKFKIVFDVGANVGEWSELVLKLNENIKIHSFEPSKYTFKILKSNLGGRQRVELNNLALGEKFEKRNLYKIEDGAGINSAYIRRGVSNWDVNKISSDEIEVDTVDNYMKKKKINEVSFVKIDVEGCEIEVLRGMKFTLMKKNVKFVQVEYGGTYIDSKRYLKDVFDIALENKYFVYKIMQSGLIRCDKYLQKYENFQYSNWLLSSENLG